MRHWDVSVANRKTLVDPFVWLTSKITQPPSESSPLLYTFLLFVLVVKLQVHFNVFVESSFLVYNEKCHMFF